MLRPSVLTYSTTYARFHPSVLNRHCTPRLNFKYNCGSDFISSKTFTTDVWKKFFRFPSLSYKRCKNFSIIFFFLLLLLLWHRPARGEKKAYKTFRDTVTATVEVSSHADIWTYTYIHTYIHNVDFHWGLPMNALQPVQKLLMYMQTHSRTHTQFWRIHEKG